MDVTGWMDAAIAGRMAAVLESFGADSAPTNLLTQIRSMPRFTYDIPPPEGVLRDDRYVPGGVSGDPEVLIAVARPTSPSGPVPGYLTIHGGGYIGGSYEADKPRLDHLVSTYGCVAVSVEYRLAPDTPYPGPLDDCFGALRYMVDNATELGIDRARVAVGGASAGGGLAAGLALLARDRGIALTHQHLIYPMIDDRQTTASSQWKVPVWTSGMNTFGWQSYLGDLYGTDDIPPYAAASRAADLGGLPPAYVHVGTLDGFLHEDIDYAARLLAAGVHTELHVYPGAPHGFDGLGAGTPLADAANATSEAALAKVLTI
jgi:acetyl esterase/lipase